MLINRQYNPANKFVVCLIYNVTVKRKPGMEQVDVLVDGEYIDELKSPDKHWVGSSNQNVIDVKVSIRENKLVLWKEG